jgi:ABC-type polysaccharide/polyol phosphate transport system ATPase subunit
MRIRLSFAIATALEPEILLIDEVFGAGDAQFMIKAQQRIEKLTARASVLVVASHSPAIIRQFCNKAMLLRAGRIEEFGDVDSTLAAYDKWVAAG